MPRNESRVAAKVATFIGQRHRYAHSLRVARLAASLARRHGVDARQAMLAGLLHDLARLWSPQRLIAAAVAYGIEIDAFAQAHPLVLHAPVGAALAAKEFGIADPAIIQAISRHTVGAKSMTPLDAILFLADALEPGRRFTERIDLLTLAYADLERGLRAVYASTVAYLLREGHTPDATMLAAIDSEACLITERRSS